MHRWRYGGGRHDAPGRSVGDLTGYDLKGKPLPPEIDVDLRAALPSHGALFNKLKKGFIRISGTLRNTLVSGLIRSDDSIDRDAMDDLATFLKCPIRGGVPTTLLSITSAAEASLTVAPGHVYEVQVMSLMNSTRAPSINISYTPVVGNAVNFGIIPGIQSVPHAVLGGLLMDSAGANTLTGLVGPLWGRAGDIFGIGDNNYVAMDVMRVQFLFIDYTLP